MREGELLEADGKFDVAGADDVLNLELGELCLHSRRLSPNLPESTRKEQPLSNKLYLEANFLDDSSILSGSQAGKLLLGKKALLICQVAAYNYDQNTSLLAPVQTILPDPNINAVVFGSLRSPMWMIRNRRNKKLSLERKSESHI